MSAAAHVSSPSSPPSSISQPPQQLLEENDEKEDANHSATQISHTQRMLESLCAAPISLGSSPAGSSSRASSTSVEEVAAPMRHAAPLGAAVDALTAAAAGASPSTSGSRVSCTPTDQVVVAATPQNGGSTELTLRNGPTTVTSKQPRDEDKCNSAGPPAEKRRRVEFLFDFPSSTDESNVPNTAVAGHTDPTTTSSAASAVGMNGQVVAEPPRQAATASTLPMRSSRFVSSVIPSSTATSLPAESWQAFCEAEIPNRNALRFALRMLASNVPAEVIPFASLVAMRAVSAVEAAKGCASSPL